MNFRLLMKNRLDRLKLLLDRLRSGQDIQSRDMKNVLTDAQWEAFNEAWDDEKSNRTDKPPKALQEYIRRKKQVALANARYIKYVGRQKTQRKTVTSKKLGNEADNSLSELIEYLKEMLSADQSLIMWLVHSEPYKSVQEMFDAGEAPTVCTSRTNSGGGKSYKGKISKRELKMKIIEDAIADFEMPSTEIKIEDVVKKDKVQKRNFSGFKV
jgi:hypothetical protein